MENKIVYLKTYIITIVVLIILFVAALGGLAYYYEGKIKELENTVNTQSTNQSGITIVQNVDTDVNDVKAE